MSRANIEVGKMIKKYRKANKYTQDELGEILQIDQSYLGRIERGEINITIDTLTKIASALKIKPSQLLENEKHVSDRSRKEALDSIDTLLLALNTSELTSVQKILKEILTFKNQK